MPYDEMIVNGSIEISSNVKIYERDENLC
uniref:Uncharacterized protein n=1 Tax=Acrobeloides nanus TaxID=290746 RepID=A0A914DB68_9BILA